MSDDLNKLFSEEAKDQVNQAEESLLKYEQEPDSTHIEDAFRALHTVKGAAYMFDMKLLGDYAHKIENILDGVKENLFDLGNEQMPAILHSIDLLNQLLSDPDANDSELRDSLSESARLLDDYQTEINELNKAKRAEKESPLFSSSNDQDDERQLQTYYLLIKPIVEVEEDDGHPIHDVIAGFKEKEFCYATAHHIKDDESEYTDKIKHWDIYLATEETYEELESYFIFYDDEFQVQIHHMANYNLLTEDAVLERIKANQQSDEKENIKALKKTVKQLEDQIQKQANSSSNQKTSKKQKQAYLRVPTEKIEKLINGISELVTSKSALDNYRVKFKDQEFTSVVEHIHQITDDLRDTILNVSLVPIDSLTVKFKRLVSDTARDLNKKVNLHIQRLETEMDKKMIDAISDPLMHIFRNSVDHGIESPEERLAKGKEETGNIYFDSYYQGANIIISLKDDGKGMDLEKIRNKAIEKGIVSTSDELTEEEIKELIFKPGFSTAGKVTGVSGRGVGMDVVLTNLKQVNGSIKIETEEDQGTEFIISLPLTLSIIDGIHTSLENAAYIFPINYIHKIERLKKAELMKSKGVLKDTVVISGEQVKIINLREVLGYNNELPDESSLIFLNEGDKSKAYMVDQVLGQIQTVIKPLGDIADDKDYLSGSTILGDGSVALVLDPNNLSQLN